MILAYFKCPICGTENIENQQVVGTRCRNKCSDKEIQERDFYNEKLIDRGMTEVPKFVPADYEYYTLDDQKLVDLVLTEGVKRKGRYEE